MKLIYENSVGRITMRGGTDAIYNITEISGLSLPEVTADTVRYPGEAGQEVTQLLYLPRTITIAGDICDKTGKHTAFMANVCAKSGTMYVAQNRSVRKISCRVLSFLPGKRKGVYVPFTLQLVADKPYFEDSSETEVVIAKREKTLSSPFIFPTHFSKRTARANILNRGSVPLEPVFLISSKEHAVCPNGIIIENMTTGERLKLHLEVLSGETIKIDIENRKISGSVQGNLIGALDAATPMSKFSLSEGINDISLTAEDETVPLFMSCHYQNKYVQALF